MKGKRYQTADFRVGGRLQRSGLGGAAAGGGAGRTTAAQDPRIDRGQGCLHRRG